MTEASINPSTSSRASRARNLRVSDPDEAKLRALVSRIAQSDQAAMGELYDATVGKVYAVARLILRNNQDAEEAACDAYAQVWHEAHRYDAKRANVIAWMLVLCRARAVDLLRKRRVRERTARRYVELEEYAAGIDDVLQDMQSGSKVRSALQNLPEVRRRAVALAFLHDLSHDEIAIVLKLPIGTVKSHIRRGLSALRAATDLEDA